MANTFLLINGQDLLVFGQLSEDPSPNLEQEKGTGTFKTTAVPVFHRASGLILMP